MAEERRNIFTSTVGGRKKNGGHRERERERASHTLDAALEERLAALAGPHAIVVPGGVVMTHSAEMHVGFPDGRRARRGFHPLRPVLRLLQQLVTADDGAAGGDGGRQTHTDFRTPDVHEV